jgi:carbon monoxide dehydrogenase subunit G
MLIEGKVTLNAPIKKIWDNILEPKTLANIVPGAESLELKGDKVYEGVIKQKLGPFSIKVKGSVTWVEFNPTTHLKGTIKGDLLGGMGVVVGDLIIDLNEVKKDEVDIIYKCSFNITGKVSVVGDRIIRAKAKDMEKEMAKNFQEKLV